MARLALHLFLAALCVLALLPAPLRAQDRASLIADRLEILANNRLVASGRVEIFFQGRRLAASGLTYDQAADRLLITGPIVLTEDDGNTVILASQADMAADLTEGILQSARIVLDDQLQLASNRMMRVGGRYTQLDRTVASSCKVCANDPTPLWEIRARRVVHDELERQIYFDHAQLRMAGVPVFYIPRLRMPDPTLKRATGFLMPTLRTTSGLGTGLRLPYFIRLGDSRDLTLAPYLSTKSGRTLDLRYRQAFRTGSILVNGAVSQDELLPGKTRGYLFSSGDFNLGNDTRLTFRTQTVTDPAYLLDYGISDADRLDSRIQLERTRRNEYIAGRLISFQTLRSDESNEDIPSFVSDFTYHRRFSLGALGGEGGLKLQNHAHLRTSSSVLDGADSDSIADGRDVVRLSARLDWRRSWVLPMGIETTVLGEVSADTYTIRQDPAAGRFSRVHGAAGVELRWPWIAQSAGGATHVIEPVVQLIASPRGSNSLLNEDSALVEFDEGNLFALNRFPGSDAVERGSRANLGVTWTGTDPSGWSLGVTAGRVFRQDTPTQFGVASGLDGRSSDWLAGLQVVSPKGSVFTSRGLFDEDGSLTKAELRMLLRQKKLSLTTGFVWAVADATENRPLPTEELTFDAQYAFGGAWVAKASGRYDFTSESGTVAGLGLEFKNECLKVDLSLSRRFTSSSSVKPATDFGLSVDLLGFGSSASAGPARTCRR